MLFNNLTRTNRLYFMAIQSDIVIIGSGVAGLSLAIQLASRRKDISIIVLAKTTESESNTNYAQGGIASVWDHETDDFKSHIDDTLDAGDDLCDPKIVRIVVEEGPVRVQELIDWGAILIKTIQVIMTWEEKEDIVKTGFFTIKMSPDGKFNAP